MNKSEAINYVLKHLSNPDTEWAYEMGYDYGMNGATKKNCSFALFSTEEKKNAWERGKADAEKDKK